MSEPCPICVLTQGYCGGSGHPNCGCFVDGVAATPEQEGVYQQAYNFAIAQGLSKTTALLLARGVVFPKRIPT